MGDKIILKMNTYRTDNSEIVLHHGVCNGRKFVHLEIYDLNGFLGISEPIECEEGSPEEEIFLDIPFIDWRGNRRYFEEELRRLKYATPNEIESILLSITDAMWEND